MKTQQTGKILLPLLGAVILGTGAALLAGKILQNTPTTQGPSSGPTQTVVVASTDITYGQVITADKLLLREVATGLVVPGMLYSIEDVDGKIATGEIYQGEPVLTRRIANKTDGSMLASLISDQMRAVTVRVNDVIGVAGFLLPGNRVDVLAAKKENKKVVTGTVLQNIKVLAVDQTVATNKETSVVVRAVTLEVSPLDSEQLFKSMQEGEIHLTLRNPTDSQQVISPVPKIKLAEAPKPKVAPPPPKVKRVGRSKPKRKKPVVPSVTVIRGTAVNKVYLPGGKP